MTRIVYEVVPHDGGWAYRQNGAYSETFPSHADALEAARIVAAAQMKAGEAKQIIYQDGKGVWRREFDDGSDPIEAEVQDRF